MNSKCIVYNINIIGYVKLRNWLIKIEHEEFKPDWIKTNYIGKRIG